MPEPLGYALLFAALLIPSWLGARAGFRAASAAADAQLSLLAAERELRAYEAAHRKRASE